MPRQTRSKLSATKECSATAAVKLDRFHQFLLAWKPTWSISLSPPPPPHPHPPCFFLFCFFCLCVCVCVCVCALSSFLFLSFFLPRYALLPTSGFPLLWILKQSVDRYKRDKLVTSPCCGLEMWNAFPCMSASWLRRVKLDALPWYRLSRS